MANSNLFVNQPIYSKDITERMREINHIQSVSMNDSSYTISTFFDDITPPALTVPGWTVSPNIDILPCNSSAGILVVKFLGYADDGATPRNYRVYSCFREYSSDLSTYTESPWVKVYEGTRSHSLAFGIASNKTNMMVTRNFTGTTYSILVGGSPSKAYIENDSSLVQLDKIPIFVAPHCDGTTNQIMIAYDDDSIPSPVPCLYKVNVGTGAFTELIYDVPDYFFSGLSGGNILAAPYKNYGSFDDEFYIYNNSGTLIETITGYPTVFDIIQGGVCFTNNGFGIYSSGEVTGTYWGSAFLGEEGLLPRRPMMLRGNKAFVFLSPAQCYYLEVGSGTQTEFDAYRIGGGGTVSMGTPDGGTNIPSLNALNELNADTYKEHMEDTRNAIEALCIRNDSSISKFASCFPEVYNKALIDQPHNVTPNEYGTLDPAQNDWVRDDLTDLEMCDIDAGEPFEILALLIWWFNPSGW